MNNILYAVYEMNGGKLTRFLISFVKVLILNTNNGRTTIKTTSDINIYKR